MKDCIFCEIVHKDPKNQVIKRYSKTELLYICDVAVFEPLNPASKGHLLFVPDIHVDNIGDRKFYNPEVVASVYKAVQLHLAENPTQCHVIANNGAIAEQTVFHLHVHIIPRYEGDNLKLIWSK